MLTLFLDLIVTMNRVTAQGIGEKTGTITISESKDGVTFTPNLSGLPPGERGFHVHTNPNCGADLKDGAMSPAEKAGPHYDPHTTHKHEGPDGAGHKGDLPFLLADADGKANSSVTKQGITLTDLRGRSLMIHEGGDNYSDSPKPLGGGGKRFACGVVQ